MTNGCIDLNERCCGEWPECTHILYWHEGFKEGSKNPLHPLPIGTDTPWGKVVKIGLAAWCVPPGETEAVAVDAGMLEAEMAKKGKGEK